MGDESELGLGELHHREVGAVSGEEAQSDGSPELTLAEWFMCRARAAFHAELVGTPVNVAPAHFSPGRHLTLIRLMRDDLAQGRGEGLDPEHRMPGHEFWRTGRDLFV